MIESIVLTDIPWQPNSQALLKRLHIEPGSDYAAEALDLLDVAVQVARPKGIYRLCFVEGRGKEHTVIDGVAFSSRIMSVNLASTDRVFAQVATCGTELHEWSEGMEDVVHRYWADVIKEMALGAASRAVSADLEHRYAPAKTARMSPGSLADWPIREQQPLFELLGDVERRIGVRLTPSFLMVPNKSTSGIRFETEKDYVNCQLCPREGCPNRRAPYDRDMYVREYAPGGEAS